MTATDIISLIKGDTQAERAVPKSGIVAWLTIIVAGIMAFLAICIAAFAFSTHRLATDWAVDLSKTSTLRLPAETVDADGQLATALSILQSAPGISQATVLDADARRALLAPWFGPDLPVSSLPIPHLIDISTTEDFDAATVSAALAEAVPDAVLDDHGAWRTPLLATASRLQFLGLAGVAMIAAAVLAMVALASRASLATNGQVIAVLRQVGATDAYITRAFVRRFTLRALTGAAVGSVAGVGAVALFPGLPFAGSSENGLGFPGGAALWLIGVPLGCAIAAFWATRSTAQRILKETA